MLASRGLRDLDDGEETIEGEAEREALRAQARAVWGRTLLVACLGTAVIYALPL